MPSGLPRRQCLRWHELKSALLNEVAGAGVARVERLAGGKAFVLAVIKTDAILAELLVLRSKREKLVVRHDHAAHHHDAGRHGGEIIVETREFLAAIHGFNKRGFEFAASAFCLGQSKKPRLRLGSVLIGFVVFVCHRVSVLGRSWFTPEASAT